MTERTFAVIKPGVLKRRQLGAFLSQIEVGNIMAVPEDVVFNIVAMRQDCLLPSEAREFYAEHAGKSFFDGLMAHMTSGPCILLVLEGDNAVENWRKAAGATDPKTASCLSLRYYYGRELPDNAVHASDSPEAAQREIAFFFPELAS